LVGMLGTSEQVDFCRHPYTRTSHPLTAGNENLGRRLD